MNLDNKKFNPLGKDWLMGKAGEESQAKDESTDEAVDESVDESSKTEDSE